MVGYNDDNDDDDVVVMTVMKLGFTTLNAHMYTNPKPKLEPNPRPNPRPNPTISPYTFTSATGTIAPPLPATGAQP